MSFTRRLLVKIRLFVATLAVASLIAVPAVFAQAASTKPADPPPMAAGPAKVAVLNVRAAIANTADGKQAAAEMQSQFAPGQASMDDLRKKLEDTEKRLQTGQNTLSDEEKSKLQRQDQILQNQARRLQEQLTEQAQAAEADIVDRISRKMDDVLRKYSAENGFTAVIDSSSQAIVYASQGSDITEAIVKLYDQTYPVKASAAPPKPATPATPKKQPGEQPQL
jgi:Skp family chaperone for outer membrane proteins